MNKLIQQQLDKCKNITYTQEDTNTINISKSDKNITLSDLYLMLNHFYKIYLENYILNPPDNFTLHTNWNNNVKPTDNIMNVEIIQIMGKMIKISGTGNNDQKFWEGWLPRKSIKILEELS